MSSPIVLTMVVPSTEVVVTAYEVTGVVTEQPFVGETQDLDLAGELLEMLEGEVIPEEEP